MACRRSQRKCFICLKNQNKKKTQWRKITINISVSDIGFQLFWYQELKTSRAQFQLKHNKMHNYNVKGHHKCIFTTSPKHHNPCKMCTEWTINWMWVKVGGNYSLWCVPILQFHAVWINMKHRNIFHNHREFRNGSCNSHNN